ncbi:winged helix-turn-helix domain-containing protein [Pseudomonadales bacterium]|nr:winged helix-turn-helix domain-containing protein [Pseudomonadales bacterium]
MHYKFGEYRFDKNTLVLFHNELPQKIEPQVAQLLVFFLDHKGQVLSRDELAAFLWPNRIVSDDALRSSVKKLREILKDDAKSPRFIKTLPMKGYEFIADVLLETILPQNTISYFKTKLAIATVSLLCLLTYIVWQTNFTTINVRTPIITQLTDIAGSELLPSFDPINNRLLFSHRSNKDDFLQLYVKEMTSGKVTRLTWDDANYGNAMWSPSGNSFAYIRSTEKSMYHYVSELDSRKGMINTARLNNDILSTHYLLAWSRNKNALYITDKTSPSKPQGIWLYDITNSTVEQITSPSVPGQGDYFVQESNDGSQLAILRSLSLNKHELLVLHLNTGQIVYVKQLPKKMHRLVWSKDNNSITMGSFDGALLRLKLSSPVIEDLTPQADFVNNVFFQCGENCYYMRQHNGNYLDIAEQPNPFIQKNIGSFGYFELNGANDFPMYANTSNKLYFVSQYSQKTAIEYIDNTGAPTTVFEFDKVAEIQSIALNSSDSHLVGLVDSSLFTYNIVTGLLTYLSKQTDIIYPPNWIDEHTFVYAKLEKHEAMLYRYSILDNTSTFLMRGYVSLVNLGNNSRLLIDKDFHLWRQENNVLTDLGILPSSQPNRFKLVGDYLYFTGRVENTNMLSRVSIDTGVVTKFELAKNRFKANFDLSADLEKLVVVESLLAQSNIIHLELD